MADKQFDWDPRSEEVLSDQIAAYDRLRRRCPVAHSDYLHWSLLRHADILCVLHDHDTFSNAVSSHLSVPNGTDPPHHTEYRRIIEPYFSAQRMRAFEPACQKIAAALVARLPTHGETELMSAFAEVFALEAQCAFLDWPADLHEPLRRWIRKNHEATLARDREAMAAVALEFDGYIKEVLDDRRQHGIDARDDVTTRLMREEVRGRPLTDEEIVSVLRNWTVGELGTIAASVGILAHYLAVRPVLQQRLRAQPSLLLAANDEILRIHAPLIASRRVTKKAVEIGGRELPPGARLTLMWASANRDEAVFGDPDEFRLDREPAMNLLYGAGIHVCPGAPLARLELRVIMEALLGGTEHIALAQSKTAKKAIYPASGFSSLPMWIEK